MKKLLSIIIFIFYTENLIANENLKFYLNKSIENNLILRRREKKIRVFKAK